MSSNPEAVVYVVDDDAAIRESISLLLDAYGIPTQTFATPQEFLDTGDLSKCSCLVLDERLPGMTGLELLDQLPNRADLPIFMVTGHGDGDMQAMANRKGVTKCFRKPFDSNELVASVQRVL